MHHCARIKCCLNAIGVSIALPCTTKYAIMDSSMKEVGLVNNKLSNVSFRIDTDIKNQADKLFADLGLNMTTAFNIFLRQSVREGSIPFQITVNTPNAVTIAAMLVAGRIASDPSVKRYSDIEEALIELKS